MYKVYTVSFFKNEKQIEAFEKGKTFTLEEAERIVGYYNAECSIYGDRGYAFYKKED